MEWSAKNIAIAIAFLTALFIFIGVLAMSTVFYVHDHGTLTVSVDGDTIDFDQPEYHDRHPTFHIHEGEGNRWHHHPESIFHSLSFERMNVTAALSTLDIHINETTITIDNETYDRTDAGVTVTITVNDEPIDPDTHLLHDGDHVRIDVETDTSM